MKYYIVKLNFGNNYVHFGDKNLHNSLIEFCADSIFSAIVNEIVKSNFLNLDEFINIVKKDEFRISDLFPYDDEKLYLPRPKQVTTNVFLQNIKFVPVPEYLEVFNNKLDNETICIIKEDEKGVLPIEDIRQQNVVMRNNESKSLPYNVGTLKFKDETGLYFIIKMDSSFLEVFQKILFSLSHTGIGGKKSIGYGVFKYSIDEVSETEEELFEMLTNRSQNKISLSIIFPTKKDIDKICEKDTYSLKRRTGFVFSTNYTDDKSYVKKREIFGFEAGSIFSQELEGELLDINDNGNHAVYKYGKALYLSI